MIRKALVVLVGVGFAALLHGCYSADCLETGTCGVVVAGADEPSCDPSEGTIDDERCPGVFVSMLGSDDNAGTRDQPMRSMDAAIDRALLDTRRIYVCAEKFAESVTIPSGVEVWGGLDCTAGWAYVGDKRKTEIVAEANAIPLRFLAGAGRAVVADVHAEAAHATIPSSSSIAVLIETDAAVDLLRSKVVAGYGARGLDGNPGGALPAPTGDPGSPGADACTAASVQGGAGALNSCRGSDSVGGTGGIGGALTGGAGTDGTPAPSPNLGGDGLGGVGQSGVLVCEPGANGAPGAPGAHGFGGRQKWGISELGLTLYPGEDGADGWPGQGGGGGGGSRAGSMICGSALNGGASGGGGGAGGCGGAGGKGGGAGGASIGILSLSSSVTIRQTVVWTGRGGDGGNGGLGQSGGAGGLGGLGGIRVGLSQDGCDGGEGGAGGPGGNGGGGVGGPSIGILHHYGDSPLSDAEIRTGEAGKGGLGGDPNVPGSAGEDGERADSIGVPPQ